jgi:hypothetical protein
MLGSIKKMKSPMFSKKSGLTKKVSARSCRPEPSSPARRTVRFAQIDSEMEAVTIRPIPSLSDMSKQEIRDMWYNDCEFQMIKLRIVHVLKKMIKGTYNHDIDSLESEARGLENKTPKGSYARKKNRFASMFAVLDEQDRQREQGQTVDSEYIAKLYRQSSAHCQMMAIQIAANDAKLVHGHQETSICKPKMSQKMMLPPASPTSNRPTLVCSIASPHRSRRRILSMMS